MAELNQLWGRAADTRRATALHYRRQGVASVFAGILFGGLGAIFKPWERQDGTATMGYIFMVLGFIIAMSGLMGLRTAGRFDLPQPVDENASMEKVRT